MTLIIVAVGFLAFLAATMFSVDVGNLMVARTQSQHAADAGALAGAVALVFDDFDDRSATGPAVQSAIAASTSTVNQVVNSAVSVEPGDVTFPALEKVRVVVHRTTARGNPVLTFLAPMFGIDSVDVGAVAVAEVVPANAATCLKPWAIPDKWEEIQTPAWDPDDEINMFEEKGKNKGTPLANPDLYRGVNHTPLDDTDYTGYRPEPQGADYGRQILLKPGSPHQAINSSHFFPIALPGGSGGSWYEDNIGGCWPDEAVIGDMVPVEPGNMTGPTTQGVQELINKDPGASWNAATQEVVNAARTPSPRIVVIPVFDPFVYEESRQHGRQDIQIANFVGFFIEELQGNNVLGRVVPNVGLVRNNGGPIPGATFLSAIRLVE
jgi:hypothetical protein